jgi:hypothetical protein
MFICSLKSAQNEKILICAVAAHDSPATFLLSQQFTITSEKPTNEMVRRLIPQAQ